MTDVKHYEYNLLSEIVQAPTVTQASLSPDLSIAVGSGNWCIKGRIHWGWVKVSHLDRTRLKYDLTPDKMAVFTEPTVFYARDSLKGYRNFRKKAKVGGVELQQKDIKQVYLESDKVIDVLCLSVTEAVFA